MSEARFSLTRLIQYLSLDVVAGAIISSLFIAKVTGVSLTIHMSVGLGIAVWLIYTVDHLWDAHRIAGKPSNPRHAFHHRYFKPLCLIAFVLLLLGLYNMSFLPRLTIQLGWGLGVLAGVYLGFVHLFRQNARWHKEFLAALVFTIGIFIAPLGIARMIDFQWLLLFLSFLLLAIINLLLFPLFELSTDQKDRMRSIATELGTKKVRRILKVLFVLLFTILLTGLILSNDHTWIHALLILQLMALVLMVLFLKPSLFRENGLYRMLGDGVFFLPVILLF